MQWLSLDHTSVPDLTPLAALTELQTLDLSQNSVTDLSPLRPLTGLQVLYLDRTSVADLTPVAALTGLQRLFLGQTSVTDLTPLAALTGLQWLDLRQTSVTDLTPLVALAELQSLDLRQTSVADLRPISTLKLSGEHTPTLDGLLFQNTEATRRDGTLRRLSLIENNQERTRDTLAYLNSLPPYPEPYLPETSGDGSPPQLIGEWEPEVPAAQPAPVEVIEVNGQLRLAPAIDGLDRAGRDLAQDGWAALRDYLADIAPLRPKIGNQMPQLSRALDRFEQAMGAVYEQAHPIALGTHGARVVAMADRPADTMADEDVAELRTFAAAVALFLERFPAWRIYRDEPAPAPLTLAEASASASDVAEIAAALTDRAAIDPAIPAALTDLAQAVKDAPGDPIGTKGLIRSIGNVLSVLAQHALAASRGLVKAGGSLKTAVLDEAKKAAAKAIVRDGLLLAGVAYDVIVNKAGILAALASRSPKSLAWLGPLLKWFGL